ncbi:MAG: hypothetical protein C4332_05980, partial [Meiothermus sp.]
MTVIRRGGETLEVESQGTLVMVGGKK